MKHIKKFNEDNRQDVIVLIHQDHIDKMSEVLEKMKSIGFSETGVHNYGAISGNIDENSMEDLSLIEGVESVDLDQTAKII